VCVCVFVCVSEALIRETYSNNFGFVFLSLGRPRRRWEDNIKLDLREIGIDGANWIQLAQDRVQ
jgi:hypothetical protein